MRLLRNPHAWLSALLALVCSCTAVNPMVAQSSPRTAREQAQEIEPMLDTAGFQSLHVSNPEQKNRLKALPAMTLGYYLDQHGVANYWLADPDYCGCLFHGDEAAYERYQLLQKDNQTAENDRQALQAQRYQQPLGPWAPPGFGPGLGFSFGPGMGFIGGGFGFSL
ncbi:MAG: hypothetical protein JO071_09425 [Deltaproteobacteria bacterium]|nr:hypothetical protein [Deltaproteobacteria bacterium]